MLILLISIWAVWCPCYFCVIHIDMTERPVIEQTISSYLEAETNLWTLLKNQDSNVMQQIYDFNVLQHIYDVNKSFLNKSLDELQMVQGDIGLVPSEYDKLRTSAERIHSLAVFCFAHFETKEEFFNVDIMIPYANNSKETIKIADGLYDVTSQSSFWTDITKYLEECQNDSTGQSMEIVQSAYQVLFDFYKEIQASLLKHYISMQVSHMLLYYHQIDADNQLKRINVFRLTFLDRIANIQTIAKTYLDSSSREVWACDPSYFYSPYDKKIMHSAHITNYLQSYVTNEANLNVDGSCTQTCEYYSQTKYYENYPENLYKCKAVLRNCIETFNEAKVCQLNGNDDRKICYIENDDGSDTSTMGNTSISYFDKQISSWTRWFVKCSNCICTCDDPSTENSDRFFSLREAVSDISKNKIVTGVKFSKQNRMIRLTISERSFMPRLQTLQTNETKFMRYSEKEVETWQENQNEFKMTDKGVRENVDYHTLTFENRGINLDTVMVPRGQVVTGVRLRVFDGRMRLEVRGTDFEYSTGLLGNIENSKWTANSNGGQNKLTLHNPAHPIQTLKKSVPNQLVNAYIEFGPSGNWADAGQTTVPFIDTQRVEPYRPVALSGVGIYYKGQNGYGGYIGSKLIIYDTSLKVTFTKKSKKWD